MTILSFLQSCFKSGNRDILSTEDNSFLPVAASGGPSVDRANSRCIFCHVTTDRGFDIVWEDSDYIVFRDYKPAAMQHFLVIPREHIGNVKTLKQADVPMIGRMTEIGNIVLDQFEVPQPLRRLGYHLPPFSSAMYPIARGTHGHEKGFSWFVEVGQAIRILERGSRVGVFPC